MEVSASKCACLASNRELGTRIQTRLNDKHWHAPHVSTAKSLGADMTAGLRRSTALTNQRLAVFVSRYRRWRALGAAGVNLARLARSGGTAILTYGQAIMGVADTFLHKQRSAVAAQAAPGAGIHGQNLDVALMLLDGAPKGRADPAFEAHGAPIGQWAMAVWYEHAPFAGHARCDSGLQYAVFVRGPPLVRRSRERCGPGRHGGAPLLGSPRCDAHQD